MANITSANPYEEKPAARDVVIMARDLTKQFGDELAVNQASFEIPRGSIFGFIGPSGSGKTTTVRLLTGIYKPTGGEAWVFGHPPTRFKRRERENIGYMPQSFVLYPDLSVWENLNFAASIYGMSLSRNRRLNQMLDFVELLDHKQKLAKNISGGMQRRLTLASTLVHDPDLLFLDEPTAAIDPVLRRKFWDFFEELRQSGKTLFVTTQYVAEAAYCDQVGIMAEGRLLLTDTPEGLRRRSLGGEVVEMKTNERIDYPRVQALRSLPFVLEGKVTRLGDTQVQIVVDDASTAMPVLIEWAQDQNLTIESIQEYLPPFDDVFVNLIKRYSNNA